MNASEPLMRCRNISPKVVRTKDLTYIWEEFGGNIAYRPSDNRHKDGMILVQAFVRNERTCRFDGKGEVQAGETVRTRVPMRSTGADQPVVVMMSGNADGAKGLNCSVFMRGQP
jgi:hypothetical protein